MQHARGRWRVVLAIAVVVVAATSMVATGVAAGVSLPSVPSAGAPGAGVAAIPSIPCPGPTPSGLVPSQAGMRYDLGPLWAAGFTGQGEQVALIELGTKVDEGYLAAYQQCLDQTPVPFFAHRKDVSPPPNPLPPDPAPGNESMADAEMIVGLAPGLARLDEFFSPESGNDVLKLLLKAALDPANNGGRVPDVISISFNTCEEQFNQNGATIDDIDPLLHAAAEAGVWVVKGAGDSGSSACASHGPTASGPGCASQPPQPLAVDYPASSPWVIAIGGIMVDSSTNPVSPPPDGNSAWSQDCGGTGGGVSKHFLAPDWQKTVPGNDTDSHRMVPDIASLAGGPGYWLFTPGNNPAPDWQWQSIEGDSMTGPFHAAAFAAVRGALASQGIEAPHHLNPKLYEIANDQILYPLVFKDVTNGNNKVFNDTCCDAHKGYDETTGLGQLDFAQLALALGFDFSRLQPQIVPAPVPVAVPVSAPAFTG